MIGTEKTLKHDATHDRVFNAAIKAIPEINICLNTEYQKQGYQIGGVLVERIIRDYVNQEFDVYYKKTSHSADLSIDVNDHIRKYEIKCRYIGKNNDGKFSTKSTSQINRPLIGVVYDKRADGSCFVTDIMITKCELVTVGTGWKLHRAQYNEFTGTSEYTYRLSIPQARKCAAYHYQVK